MRMIIAIAVIIAANIALIGWSAKHQPSVARWAAENELEVVEAQHRTLRRGPFWWVSGRGCVVYWVRARDRNGVLRTGFVRFGLGWFRNWTGEATVIWDNPQ